MFKNIFILIPLLIAGVACSGSGDSIQEALQIPPINSGGEVIEPKSLSVDVPGIPDGSTYYGKYTLTLGEELAFNLGQNTANKVLDLEFSSSEEKQMYLDQFFSFSMGECSDRESNLMWMEISPQGDVLSEESVSIVNVITAKAGGRYLLRMNSSNTSGCDQLSVSFIFSETK